MGSQSNLNVEVKDSVKICLVGNSTVGKSCLAQRFTQAHFIEQYSGEEDRYSIISMIMSSGHNLELIFFLA